MHQGTQDWDWDTLWERFEASGVWQAADPESQQFPAPDQPTVIAKLLGIQCLAAHLAPEGKDKITQSGFGYNIPDFWYPGTQNFPSKPRGNSRTAQNECAVISQPQIQST